MTIGTLIVLVSIPWWILYFVRLFYVVQRGHFTRMPNLYMYFNAFGLGALYYLCSYEIEQRLQQYLLFTHQPFVSIIKIMTGAGLVTYGYILMVRRYTRFTVTRKVDMVIIGFMGLTIILNLILYDRVPYFKLQQLTNVLMSVAVLLAGIPVLPIMRQVMSSPQNRVREAHHLWYIASISASGLASLLMLIDGVQKLLTDSAVIYSLLFVMTEISHSIHIIASAFLIAPDRYLYWIYYPRRLITYLKLRRLAERIHHQTQVQPNYDIPMPRLPTLSALEFTNYRLFIVIMDTYRHLPEDSSLNLSLRTIDHLNAPYEETIQKLQKLI